MNKVLQAGNLATRHPPRAALSLGRLIDTDEKLAALLPIIKSASWLAVDTEADSLHAYPEKICLLQISTAAGRADLEQTNFFGVGVQTVGFRIKSQPGGGFEDRQQRGEFFVGVNQAPPA